MRIHETAEWLLIADEDTVSAEILNKENNLVNSYYHCSQAMVLLSLRSMGMRYFGCTQQQTQTMVYIVTPHRDKTMT